MYKQKFAFSKKLPLSGLKYFFGEYYSQALTRLIPVCLVSPFSHFNKPSSEVVKNKVTRRLCSTWEFICHEQSQESTRTQAFPIASYAISSLILVIQSHNPWDATKTFQGSALVRGCVGQWGCDVDGSTHLDLKGAFYLQTPLPLKIEMMGLLTRCYFTLAASAMCSYSSNNNNHSLNNNMALLFFCLFHFCSSMQRNSLELRRLKTKIWM